MNKDVFFDLQGYSGFMANSDFSNIQPKIFQDRNISPLYAGLVSYSPVVHMALLYLGNHFPVQYSDLCYLGTDGENGFYAVRKTTEDRMEAVFLKIEKNNTKKLKMACITKVDEKFSEKKLSADERKQKEIRALLILCAIHADKDAYSYADAMGETPNFSHLNVPEWGTTPEEQKEAGFRYHRNAFPLKKALFDVFYDSSQLGEKIDNPSDKSIGLLKKDDFQNLTSLYGENPFFSSGALPDTNEQGKPIVDMWAMDENGFMPVCKDRWLSPSRVRTEEEIALIPVVHDKVIPEYIKEDYTSIIGSTFVPCRNLYYRGGAGIGKTEGCKILASALGLPYLTKACSDGFTISDVLGDVFPVNTEEKSSISEETYENIYSEIGVNAEILSFDELLPLAYEKLTGEKKENPTRSECMAVLLKKVAEVVSKYVKSGDDKGIRYEYVESGFIKAIRNGWFFELQEPTVIARAGVLVGLNELLCQEGTILLPNGEEITRHPDCVVAFTSNATYDGCYELNASIISRMNKVHDLDSCTAEMMAVRASALFKDALPNEWYKQMAKVIKLGENFEEADDESSGICSFREYLNWIQELLLLKSDEEVDHITHEMVIKSLESTVKHKVAQKRECFEGFEASVLAKWSLTVDDSF